MPVFELPLDKLREYQGRNPRPADFEDYWDRALAEMRAVDPGIELVPHELNARTPSVSISILRAWAEREYTQNSFVQKLLGSGKSKVPLFAVQILRSFSPVGAENPSICDR